MENFFIFFLEARQETWIFFDRLTNGKNNIIELIIATQLK